MNRYNGQRNIINGTLSDRGVNGDDFQSKNRFPLYTANVSFPDFLGALKLTTEYVFDNAVTTFASISGVAENRHITGKLAPNGKIYWPPYALQTVISVFDTKSGTSYTIGGLPGGSNQWVASVLIGDKIFCVPQLETRILIIDTSNDSYTFNSSSFTTPLGSTNYASAVLSSTGYVYLIPQNGTIITKVDSKNYLHQRVGEIDNTAAKFLGACLASNGMIYACPLNSSYILKINPFTDEITKIEGVGAATGKWNYLIQASNGFLYGISRNATTVLKINPFNDTFTTFGSLAATSNKYITGCLGADGFIYGWGFASTNILKINPNNDTVTTIANSSTSTNNWLGPVLAPNGAIYAAPGQSSVTTGRPFQRLNTPVNHELLNRDFVLSRYFKTG